MSMILSIFTSHLILIMMQHDKNKIIIETGGGELVDASAMEIDRSFVDQYRTAIIINDEVWTTTVEAFVSTN